MSAAVVVKPGGPGYLIHRPLGRCAISGSEIAPGDAFMAMVKESTAGLERVDVSLAEWDKVDASDALAYWRAVMPKPDAVKKKPFVDDETLTTLFERLANADEPHKVHFRSCSV